MKLLQAAHYLSVSPNTIRTWIRCHGLPAQLHDSEGYIIDNAALEEWLSAAEYDYNLYLAQADTGELKIGVSVDPQRRVKSLEYQLGRKVRLLKVWTSYELGMSRKIESQVKDKFKGGSAGKSLPQYTEWFIGNESEVIRFVDALKSNPTNRTDGSEEQYNTKESQQCLTPPNSKNSNI